MKLLLTTLHAKYAHSSLALPCLAVACEGIPGVDITILELTINEQHDLSLSRIVSEAADIVAFSCYIWNINQTLRLASDLKKVCPETFLLLGGPEVSFNSAEVLQKNRAIDCIIMGEGEETFRKLVEKLQQSGMDKAPLRTFSSGIAFRSGDDIIVTSDAGSIAALDDIPSPFSAGLVKMEKPLIYLETSRGCPFSCAFCISSIETGVRSFSMERIVRDLSYLMENNALTVKLVDRTFNYDAKRANEIWGFILQQNRNSRFHFEIAADLLTSENITLLQKVPPGLFRFEIGVQSGEGETLVRVGRETNLVKLFANVEFLRERTGIVIHLDLVAGLPHEDFTGFLHSLQRLFAVLPQHIQVEPLKVLKGSPMESIALEEGYQFSDYPPYKILKTPWLSYREITRVEKISRLLDLFYNSGKFRTTMQAVAERVELAYFFDALAHFTQINKISGDLSQPGLFGFFRQFITSYFEGEAEESITDVLFYDFCLSEYPASGALAIFWGPDRESPQATKGRGETTDIVKTLDIKKGCKTRTYLQQFKNDYSSSPWGKGEAEILFVYISGPGLGLRVKTVELSEGRVARATPPSLHG